MAFDPCGTRRLDGDDIIRRIAEALNIAPEAFRIALLRALSL
jgi:hypothetical protein